MSTIAPSNSKPKLYMPTDVKGSGCCNYIRTGVQYPSPFGTGAIYDYAIDNEGNIDTSWDSSDYRLVAVNRNSILKALKKDFPDYPAILAVTACDSHGNIRYRIYKIDTTYGTFNCGQEIPESGTKYSDCTIFWRLDEAADYILGQVSSWFEKAFEAIREHEAEEMAKQDKGKEFMKRFNAYTDTDKSRSDGKARGVKTGKPVRANSPNG